MIRFLILTPLFTAAFILLAAVAVAIRAGLRERRRCRQWTTRREAINLKIGNRVVRTWIDQPRLRRR